MRQRRAALASALAFGAASFAGACRPAAEHRAFPAARLGTAASAARSWQLFHRHLAMGPPSRTVGLVQGQQLFGHAAGGHLLRSGLVRVRIPARLIRLGDEAWHPSRFPDGWWMERLRDLRVPFKAVIELPIIEIGPHFLFTDEQHASHATRLARRFRPDVVIIGNEVNVVDRQPGVNLHAVIERYLHRYALIYRAIKNASPQTHIQLYGEAYYGEPSDPNAILRRILQRLRERGLPPPDLAGMHVYDHAGPIPERARGYRRLLADYGLRIPLSVEELGPRMGVVDRDDEAGLAAAPIEGLTGASSRLDELRAAGWISEDEHADLVVQHLATAVAAADQAQIFCAADFRAELQWRRGLVSYECGRPRPAFEAFHFTQRLLAGAAVRLIPAHENDGVACAFVTRADSVQATICWSAPVAGETRAGARTLNVPPHTFVCDARGRLVLPPRPAPETMTLPGSATSECGGAVRVLL